MTKKRRIIKLTSIFPAPKHLVFELLQEFKTLSKIAYPYITFTPMNDSEDLLWKEGNTFIFKTKLFGFIPFGTHTIHVVEFNKDKRIYTNESNTYVPIWNHEIILKNVNNTQTKYTDIVEIYAGWKTYFVYIWAKLFYVHRQKKWIKLIHNKMMYERRSLSL